MVPREALSVWAIVSPHGRSTFGFSLHSSGLKSDGFPATHTYSLRRMMVYFNGNFCAKEEVCISPDDRGFLLADGVYEVLCAYEGRLFRADAHFDRLKRSLGELRMSGPNAKEAESIATELLRRNDLVQRNAKVYLQVTRGAAPRQHAFPDESVSPTVYAVATPYDPPLQKWKQGVRVITRPDLRWARCDIKSTALLPNVLANQRAMEADAYEALLVREGVVTEGSHCSFFGVFDGSVVTHPLTNHILPGITRSVVMELCRNLNIPVHTAPIAVDRLAEADELFLAGTTTGIMPIVHVDDGSVQSGHPGPLTQQLQQAFREMTGL